MSALIQAMRVMFHPFALATSGRSCAFCGTLPDRAIHDLATARRHGFDWTSKCGSP